MRLRDIGADMETDNMTNVAQKYNNGLNTRYKKGIKVCDWDKITNFAQ